MNVLDHLLASFDRGTLWPIEDEHHGDRKLGESGKAEEERSKLGNWASGGVIASKRLLDLLDPDATNKISAEYLGVDRG